MPLGKVRNIRHALMDEIKPKHRVLVIGPSLPFLDATPLTAAHIVQEKGRLTIMDSRKGGKGKVSIGTPAAGDLALYERAMQRLVQMGALKISPEYRVGDIRAMQRPQKPYDVILERNMLVGHGPAQRDRIIEGYRQSINPGGKVIVIVDDTTMGRDPNDFLTPRRRRINDLSKRFQTQGFKVAVNEDLLGVCDLDEIPAFAQVKHLEELNELRALERGTKMAKNKAFVLVATKLRR